jgi:hypothetical protein
MAPASTVVIPLGVVIHVPCRPSFMGTMGIVVAKSEMTGLVPADATQLPEPLPPEPVPPVPVVEPPEPVVVGPVVVGPLVVDPPDPAVVLVDPAPPAPDVVAPVVVCPVVLEVVVGVPPVVCVLDVDEPAEPELVPAPVLVVLVVVLGFVVEASSEQATRPTRRMLGPMKVRLLIMIVPALSSRRKVAGRSAPADALRAE